MMGAVSTGPKPGTCLAEPEDPRTRAALADLELLARWYPRLHGRALGLDPPVDRSATDRAQMEDARTAEWHRAMAVHRRFEALRTGAGCLHHAVLEWLFLTRGGEERTRWVDLLGALGWAFATPVQRRHWTLKRKSVAHAAPRAFGQRLYDAAVAAWVDLR